MAKSVGLLLPDDVFDRLNALAAERRQPIHEVAAEAVAAFVSPPTGGLTARQREAFAFIAKHIAENEGVPPSYDEIAAGLGLRGKSNISRIITCLEERGFIKTTIGRARSIEIVRAA